MHIKRFKNNHEQDNNLVNPLKEIKKIQFNYKHDA